MDNRLFHLRTLTRPENSIRLLFDPLTLALAVFKKNKSTKSPPFTQIFRGNRMSDKTKEEAQRNKKLFKRK